MTDDATTTPADLPVRVMVVDDHAVIRDGLRAFARWRDDVDVVGEAATSQEALVRLAMFEQPPDVLVTDLGMPGGGGVALIAEVRERYPEVQVLALTGSLDDSDVSGALRAGAVGYILKDAGMDAVMTAVLAAHHGEMTLDPRAARVLAASLSTPPNAADQLTPRERDVVVLVAQGLSNKQIARRLSVSERTARTHVSNILGKLALASRTQLALWAVEHDVTHRPA